LEEEEEEEGAEPNPLKQRRQFDGKAHLAKWDDEILIGLKFHLKSSMTFDNDYDIDDSDKNEQ